jgi:type III secretory pathway component EscU
MAARDANRFLVGLVVMTIVFALLLPVMALMYFDLMDMKAQIRAEAKDLRRLKKEMQQEIQQVKEK